MAFDEELAERVRGVLASAGLTARSPNQPPARFDMGRGPSRGWVVVSPDGIATDEALTGWVGRALAYATSLPPK
jgi:hypothetical protein